MTWFSLIRQDSHLLNYSSFPRRTSGFPGTYSAKRFTYLNISPADIPGNLKIPSIIKEQVPGRRLDGYLFAPSFLYIISFTELSVILMLCAISLYVYFNANAALVYSSLYCVSRLFLEPDFTNS